MGTEFLPNADMIQRLLESKGEIPNCLNTNIQAQTSENEAMHIDHVHVSMRKKNIDLSEVEIYKLPSTFLPLLHGPNGESLSVLQQQTETLIQAPKEVTTSLANVSIYGYVRQSQDWSFQYENNVDYLFRL